MILYVNACVREGSRTQKIASALLEKLGGKYEEVRLAGEGFCPLSDDMLKKRTDLIAKRDYSDPMFSAAKKFALADVIVIAAPYWDLSFPAVLKTYLENIYVTGIVSEYGPDGIPHGLCRAGSLYYVTTSGGPYMPDFSYDYVKGLAAHCFGIRKTSLIKAEMLDVQGFDADGIVKDAILSLDKSIIG